jgi:hypothetical protein
MGLVEKFLTAGCRQRVIKLHSDGELLGTIDLAGCGSIYGFNVGLSEETTESILTGLSPSTRWPGPSILAPGGADHQF